ncbi:histidine kinase [Haliscomenobacter hydrossis]|uniref:Signal transduction histidine kinase n=1 Tax=Haliscomenobacter hydrossis (strain ATCC 27775 / DSM 1100 / LMG 10767 / O) TaxID=760192 RepID=F4L5U1_HALH1|nr:histidine kinase [Haliscomenobacter hydrossis]AEE52051.1 putative signal transduction histidine kinase [Haliscomenobacter hydrossis DSM 1100]
METEGYFKTLIESINDLVQVIRSDGSIMYSSSQLESLGGYTNEEAAQLEPFQWIHPEDRACVITQFEAQKKAGFDHYQTDYRIITKSNAVKYVETKVVNALENPLVNGIIAVVRDVTQRVEAEETIRKPSQLYQIMTDISKRFLNQDVESATKYMLTHLGQFAVVDRAYVYTLDKERQHWDCIHEWRRPESDQFPSIFNQVGFPITQGRWMQEELAAGRIVNIGNLDEMPPEASETKDMFESDLTLSILLLPMLTNGQLIGFIGYDSVLEPKIWQEDDITALTICTEILTSAMLRSEAESATKQSLSVNAAIIESTAEGILVTDLDDNVIVYNTTFIDMWQIPAGALPLKKARVALQYALEKVENREELLEKASLAATNVDQPLTITAYFHNKRVIECISKPQIIEGKVVGRVWSNRDITSRILAEREERERGVAQAQFESLKNQINPHFLFNSLNVLASLVHVDTDLSEKFIDQLARSYRYLLEQKDNDLVLLKTEIDFVHSFTFLLKIRFEEKLKVNIRLDKETMGYYVAPLTLQLLIENAVKHNRISAKTPLVIDIYNEGDEFLVVSNNLQLRDKLLPSTGVGQNNIKSRYKLFTKTEVVFVANQDKYTVRIPFIKNA